MSQLDRRGRRIQLRTLALLLRRGPQTEDEVARVLGGQPEHVGRRLRRYARRGWVGRDYSADRVRYFLRAEGRKRARWIYRAFVKPLQASEKPVRTASESEETRA